LGGNARTDRYVENLIKQDLGWESQEALENLPATADEFDRRFDAGEDLADLGVDLSKATLQPASRKKKHKTAEERPH